MPKSQRTRFQEHYGHVEDIDLFSGGISELPLIDGIVGPTFACVMGIQFNHLKFGDRYYFEHGGQEGSFTEGSYPRVLGVECADQVIYRRATAISPQDPLLQDNLPKW